MKGKASRNPEHVALLPGRARVNTHSLLEAAQVTGNRERERERVSERGRELSWA